MATFYLSKLDTSETLTVAATMSGESGAITADKIIEKDISLSKAKTIFKVIFTGGSLTANVPTGKFTTDADFLSAFESEIDDGVLGFVDKLVQEMTGSSGASDILDNEADIKTEILARIESGITTIEAGAGAGNAACIELFNQIKAAYPGRFELISSVPATAAGNNFTGKTYTNCLVTSSGTGAGAKVNSFVYEADETGTPPGLQLTVTGNDVGSNDPTSYTEDNVLLFIHPGTGTGFFIKLSANQATSLNGNGTTTLTMTEITTATNGATFSLFKKINSGDDTTTVTPSGTPVLTIEVTGGAISDTTITTANTSDLSPDFTDGDTIVAYKLGETPEAIVLTLNTITAAYLNNDLAHADGVSLPLESTDKLDVKLTLATKGDTEEEVGQTDASGDAITFSYSFGFRGKLALA